MPLPTERALDRFAPRAHRRLNRFALDFDRFARSTPPPLAPEHAIDLDRFTDAPDRALRSTPSFSSPQVIHEELANCCKIQIYDKVPT
jgi:hypothetical protein